VGVIMEQFRALRKTRHDKQMTNSWPSSSQSVLYQHNKQRRCVGSDCAVLPVTFATLWPR